MSTIPLPIDKIWASPLPLGAAAQGRRGFKMSERADILSAKTLQIMRDRPHHVTLTSIAKATDLDMAWLSRFQHDQHKRVNVDKVQTLFEHLAGRRLKV